MFGFLKEKKEAVVDPRSWIGKTIIAAKTIQTSNDSYHGTRVVEASTLSGTVTNAGDNVVCIDDTWYELDQRQVGGLRVIEVVKS